MKKLSKQVLLTRIAARLKALGTSANAIGPKAGVSRDFVRNIKRRGWPTLDNFWALAQALECSPFYLVGLTDNPTGDPYAEPLDISELKDFIAIAISEATQSGNHLTTEEIATVAAEAFAENRRGAFGPQELRRHYSLRQKTSAALSRPSSRAPQV